MAEIGVDVDPDSLILWRGRDFRWTFTNLGTNRQPEDFPNGRLFLELQTGGQHNAVQEVYITGATGGTYLLGDGLGGWTSAIDYNDVSENPQGLAGDITDALEGLYGSGNIDVRPVTLFPSWTLNFNLNSGKPLTEQLVNIINKAANDFFNTFDSLLGVNVEMTVTDALNFKLQVTSIKSFSEVGILTFAVDVTSTAVKNFFNGVSGLIGAVNTVNVDFYWNRTYRVVFRGDLAEKPVPQMQTNVSSLTGANKQVTTRVILPGKERLTLWECDIAGSAAFLKVESEECDKVAHRTKWQLFFLPEGELAGGDPIGRGMIQKVG